MSVQQPSISVHRQRHGWVGLRLIGVVGMVCLVVAVPASAHAQASPDEHHPRHDTTGIAVAALQFLADTMDVDTSRPIAIRRVMKRPASVSGLSLLRPSDLPSEVRSRLQEDWTDATFSDRQYSLDCEGRRCEWGMPESALLSVGQPTVEVDRAEVTVGLQMLLDTDLPNPRGRLRFVDMSYDLELVRKDGRWTVSRILSSVFR